MTLSGAAQTNVHRVDGVLFVQWAKFLPHAVHVQAQTTPASGSSQPAQSSETRNRGDRDVKVLDAISRLRDVGYLMRWPEDEDAIWVFELPKGIKQPKEEKPKEKDKSMVWVLEHPKPTKAVKQKKDVDYVKVLGDCGYTKARAGSLRAMDLKATHTAKTDEHGSENPSTEATRVNEQFESRRIHRYFITAIRKTMLYSLAVSIRYFPVTPNTFLDTYTRFWISSAYNAFHLDPLASGTQLSTLDVRWFPSGTLVISSSFSFKVIRPQTPKSMLSLLSHRLTGQSQSIILAPFGLDAKLEPAMEDDGACTLETVLGGDHVERDVTILGKNRRRWFTSLIAMLRFYGVSVPGDVQWLAVRVSLQYRDTNEETAEDTSELVLWPASLCVIGEADSLEEEADNSWAWDDGDSKASDPLAEAEAWYLGKDARQELLDARERQKELEAQKKASPHFDVKDSLGNELPVTHKFLDAQTASGIYPTPPDGQPFHAGTVTTTGELDSTKPVEEANTVLFRTITDGDPMQIDSTFAQTEELVAHSNDDDAMDEDDMFGAMNTGMFTATGLTEDDFNFFDEHDESIQAEPSPALAASIEAGVSPNIPGSKLNKADGEDWDMLTGDSPMQPLKREKSPESRLSVNQASINSRDDEIHGTGQAPADKEEENLLIQTRGNNSSVQTNRPDVPTNNDTEQITTTTGTVNDDEFGPVAVDRKYSAAGKYASELSKRPSGERPSIMENFSHNVPNLNLRNKSMESDEASDSGDEMSQSSSPSIIFEDEPMTIGQDSSTSPATPSILKRKRSLGQSENAQGSDNGQTTLSPGQRRVPPLINVSTIQIISCFPPSLRDVLVAPSWLKTNFTGYGQEFIDIGQLVTEQAVLTSTFANEESLSFGWENLDYSAFNNTPVQDPLQGMITHFFPHSKKIELSGSIIAPEQIVAATQAPKATPKPPNRLGDTSKLVRRPNDRSESIYELPIPNVLAHRVDDLMELSSMALSFWEELGLAPCKGGKNVRGVCVIPRSEPMRRAASSFHDAITGFWQSMRLGSHTPLNNIDALSDGCLEVPFVRSDRDENYQSLAKACKDLGQHICDSEVTETNIVIYMVNPYHPIKALPYLCTAFTRAKEHCHDFATARDLHLVLKVLPLSLFAVRDTLALPSPSVYRQLARDVYDLCALHTPSLELPEMTSSTLVQLANEIPKKLEFRLSADASSPLAHADSSFHVGYSFDEQGHWLTMALTDACGTRHWKASYCLRAVERSTGLQGCFEDFWEITLAMIGSAKAHARVVVTKDEAFSPFEINAWTSLASDPISAPVALILVSLDLSPSLQVSPSPTPPSANPRQPAMPTTPLTPPTPGPNTPTASGPLDTSSIDPSLRLISTEDQTWAILNIQPIDQDPAIPVPGHGMLMMNAVPPGGLREGRSEGYRSLGVQIVHHALPCATTVLRDVLKSFRALGVVAKARGMVGSRGGLLPWHIAVAREARMALDRSMQWEEMDT